MPIEQKKSKIIVRDNDGELVQLLPETDASQVNYGNTTVQSVIDEMAGNEVEQVYAEIDPHSKTETEEVHLEPEGLLTASSDSPGNTLNVSFAITFFYSGGSSITLEYVDENIAGQSYNSLWLGRFHTADGTVLCESSDYYVQGQPITARANERYYYDFTLQNPEDVVGLNAMLSGCAFYDAEQNSEFTQNTIGIIGSPTNSYSEYATYNQGWFGTSIEFSLPAVGESTTLHFNTEVNVYSYSSDAYTNIENLNKTLTFENIDGTNFRMSFYWDTAIDETVTTTTNWKELKTTMELNNGNSVVVNKPIAGLLQDAKLSRASKYVIETIDGAGGTYYPYICINDHNPANDH